LDEVIEKIRRLMVESVETSSEEKLSRRSRRSSSSSKKQQQGSGARRLQTVVWDPGGFQQLRVEAHEQELMNFTAEEYDAGASLHVSQPATSVHAFKAEERRNPRLQF
jgi:hypothetical protein